MTDQTSKHRGVGSRLVAPETPIISAHLEMLHRCAGPHSSAAFLVKHGRPFHCADSAVWPRWIRRGAMKECYRNAANLVLRNPDRLAYCEGYAIGVIPVEHAWVVDTATGAAYDPTWRAVGPEYYGVAIQTDYLRRHIAEVQSYCLLFTFRRHCPLVRGTTPPSQWEHPLNRNGGRLQPAPSAPSAARPTLAGFRPSQSGAQQW